MTSAPFVVRSEMSGHEDLARLPYGQVHLLKTSFLDGASMSELARAAYNQASVLTLGDINTAWAREETLQALAPSVPDLHARIAGAISSTGVYGSGEPAFGRCRLAVERRTDFLASLGAGFHNDCFGHWPSCLFWVLALDVVDVEFVVPHLGVRMLLEPGDLVVFDPSLAHGLCRPRDGGRFVPAHFEGESGDQHQAFLSGELELGDAEWAALGCAWQPAGSAQFVNAVDLLNSDFDAESGCISRRVALAA